MSTKKKRKINHSSHKSKDKDDRRSILMPEKKKPTDHRKQEHKAKSHPPWKVLPLEEPDVSRILKVAEDNQLEDLNDSFDHPLHSTAVDAYGEECSQNKSLGHVSSQQRKKPERRKKMRHSKPSDSDVQKFSSSGPEDEPRKDNVKALNTTQLQAKKKRQPSEDSTSDLSEDGPCSVQLWCPKELKRSSRDITELDVVLAEFEKITANYKPSIESNICRKAINGFCSAFKGQIADLIVEAQQLKDIKKKNAKVVKDISKKSQQLLQLREELIRAEPQLIQLKREYAEMQERTSALRQATEFVTGLKELQQDYLEYREENPKEQEIYGLSSLPALLVESRRILGAEGHFQNINRKLEEALAVQRGKLSEKH